MGRKKVEVKKTYSDYKYVILAFAPDDEALEELAEARPEKRTALIKKWHQLAQLDVWWMLRDAATANDDNPELQQEIWKAMDTINKINGIKRG